MSWHTSTSPSTGDNSFYRAFYRAFWKFVLVGDDKASDECVENEIKNMRKHFREGEIVDVKAGEEFQINGTALYPLDMKICNVPCHAYMLLRRNGLFEDAEYTPYFFKSRTTRDEVLEWMQR